MNPVAGAPFLLGLESTALTENDRSRIERWNPSGFLLLALNIDRPRQVRSLTDSLRELNPGLDPIIAIEEESGDFSHLGQLVHPTPTPAALGAQGNPRAIAEHGAATGVLLSLMGINLNLAPVLDLAPDAGGEARRWHHDHQMVIDHAGTWNRWLRRQKVCCGAKHFPAGGRPAESPVSVDDLLKEDLIPSTALMPELDAIVVGHQRLPAIDPAGPASLSQRIVTGLLRNQLGFDHHLVITEDLSSKSVTSRFAEAEACPLALSAGNDLVMMARNPGEVAQALSRINEVPAPIRQDAEIRIERFRKKISPPLQWSDKRWAKAAENLLRA